MFLLIFVFNNVEILSITSPRLRMSLTVSGAGVKTRHLLKWMSVCLSVSRVANVSNIWPKVSRIACGGFPYRGMFHDVFHECLCIISPE